MGRFSWWWGDGAGLPDHAVCVFVRVIGGCVVASGVVSFVLYSACFGVGKLTCRMGIPLHSSRICHH